jgi:predicted dehydrogenase
MRIIQVGVGKMGRTWSRVLRAAPGVAYVAVVEPAPANREWAMTELGLSESDCLVSVKDALARDDWDAAVVVTPPATHRAVAETLLRGGRHVLLEKPLATTLEDGEALVRIAEETGRILMVAQNYRYRPQIRAVQAAIRQGAIGAIRSVAIRFHRDTRTVFGAGDFRYRMEEPLIVDMAVHHFDMLRAMTGLDVTDLYGRSWHVPGGVYEHHPAAAVIMTLTNGATVTYDGNWAGFDTDTSWDGEWDIVGDTGRIRWRTDGQANVVDLVSLDGTDRPLVADDDRPTDQAGLLADFVSAVSSGRQPATSAEDNVRSLAIVLGAVESSNTSQLVRLSQPGDSER